MSSRSVTKQKADYRMSQYRAAMLTQLLVRLKVIKNEYYFHWTIKYFI